ncbi:exo-alpha-sialidase [Streptomyces sp. NPDC001270]|uniref:golvesin C-terminal-like domain-containing protein n=2 Tax=unclassified Streptomyces TaxID=2593676 RepID=UPI0036A5C663
MTRSNFRRTLLRAAGSGLALALALLVPATNPEGTPAATVAQAMPATVQGAADAGSFDESELWDSTAEDAYASFHVQGLAVVPEGTVPPAGGGQALPDDVVLTFTEGRFVTADGGDKDLLVRRSTDGGRTWSASAPVVPAEAGQSWGSATPVVDEQTGRVFLFYKGSADADGVGSVFVRRSDDAGATWSAPEDLTSLFAANPYGWTRNSPTPGHGIQLRTGRLLMPVTHRAATTAADANYGVDMLYSDDHGVTWRRSAPVPVDTAYPINESRVYERNDGSVVVGGRWGSGGTRYRITATSSDGGKSWSAPVIDGAVAPFNSVDAGLLRYSHGSVDRLLFSRPDSSARENMTVSISYDEGASYRYSRVVDTGPSYYSDLARLSDGTILLVYGRDGSDPSFPERIAMARFDLAWLTQGRDSLATGPGLTRYDYELATPEARTDTGGSPSIVSDPNALGGRRIGYTAPGGAGDYVQVPFDVAEAGTYEVAVRVHRHRYRGVLRVSVDDRALTQGLIDPTVLNDLAALDDPAVPVGEGYQVYRLGTVTLDVGRHTIRFTLAGPGYGGDKGIGVDQLTLTAGGSAPDVPDAVADNDFAPGFETVSGAWTRVAGTAGNYGQSCHRHAASTSGAQVRFRPDVPMSGVYAVSTWYPADKTLTSRASYVVEHAEGRTTVKVDQSSGGGTWVPLGEFTFSAGGGGAVELSADAGQEIAADAVRLSYRGAVVDNDSAGYEAVAGDWNKATGVTGYYGDSYRTHPAGTGDAVVRWRADVPVGGACEVAVWYTAASNRASDAPYTVHHAGGSTVVRVDQREHGGQWVSLGDFRFTAGQPATVELSDAADGYVIADAVRLVRR